MRSIHTRQFSRTSLLSGLPLAIAAAVMTVACSTSQAQQPAPPHDYQALQQATTFWGYFKDYCTDCHNLDDFSGGIDFTDAKPADVPAKPELFETVLVKLRGRMMPPPNKSRPDETRTDAFVGWLEN